MLAPRGTTLLYGALLGALLAAVGGSMPVSVTANKCPDHIDCAQVGRHFCLPGSSQCGPCLAPLEEDKKGRCVAPKHDKNKKNQVPDLDEEIDYLLSRISQQQESHVKQPVSPSWPDLRLQAEESVFTQKSVTHSTTEKPPTRSPSTPTQQTQKPQEPHTGSAGRGKPIAVPFPRDSLLVIMMGICIVLGMVALIMAVVCWVRLQKESHLAEKVDYPAFNPVGTSISTKNSSGDRKLAQSAQMYHYHHQKQQMLSMEKHKSEAKVSESAATSDEETEGDFTVYECPGLAPTGEMEVKNPLFDDSALHPERNHK